MPLRTTPLATGEFYHVYNRGVAHQTIFWSGRDYGRFLLTLSYYRFDSLPVRLSHLLQLPREERSNIISTVESKNQKLIEIVSFVLMPNHFHLLLRQSIDNGIRGFVGNVSNSYVKYVNTKYERVGPLLQGPFKAVRIQTDEQLIHVSRYIHLNPLVSLVVREENFLSYPWSSMQDFLNGASKMVNTEPVLSHFVSPEEYKKFVFDQADYGKKLERIKHLVLE